MRTSDRDERKIQIRISQYAPPRYRAPAGEGAARPARERLSRGAADGDASARDAQRAPAAEPIHVQNAVRSPAFPLSMTGRLAIAMGLVAVLATASFAFLGSRAGHEAQVVSAQPRKTAETTGMTADMPKPVHTVTLRPPTAAADEAQSSPATGQAGSPPVRSAASVADRIGALAPKTPARVRTALALTDPLKLWAMIPDDTSEDVSDPAAAPAQSGDATDAGSAKSAKSAKEDARPKRTAARHHRAKARRHARRRGHARRRTRAVAAKPKPARTAAQASATQPVKKLPLQAALDALFGEGGGGGNAGAAGSAAPAAPQSAFQ